MEKVNMQMARRWMRVAITLKRTRQPGAEVNLQRVVESILPVASLYGVDIANIDN